MPQERARLAGSEIEEELLAELQKLATVVARLQQQYDLDPALPRQPDNDEAAERGTSR